MDAVEFSDVLCRYPLGANPRGVKEYGGSSSFVTHACIVVIVVCMYTAW